MSIAKNDFRGLRMCQSKAGCMVSHDDDDDDDDDDSGTDDDEDMDLVMMSLGGSDSEDGDEDDEVEDSGKKNKKSKGGGKLRLDVAGTELCLFHDKVRSTSCTIISYGKEFDHPELTARLHSAMMSDMEEDDDQVMEREQAGEDFISWTRVKQSMRVHLCHHVLPQKRCQQILRQVRQVDHLFKQSAHEYANTVQTLVVWHIPALYALFLHLYHTFLRPVFAHLYDVELPVVEVGNEAQYHDAFNDIFVSKYTPGAYAKLPMHRDAEDYAFVLQLNDTGEFDGGGIEYTEFEPAENENENENRKQKKQKQKNTSGLRLSPSQGDMLLHPGFVKHGSVEVTRGE